MKTLHTMLRRLLGCFGVAVCLALFVFGGIAFVMKINGHSDISVTSFLVTFIMTGVLLLACNLLYLVNPTLWNAVDTAKENREEQSLLQLLPNVKLLVDMCEFVGTFRTDYTP